MKIFVNNEEISNGNTIRDISAVIEYAEKEAGENDSIIEGIFINGISVDEISEIPAESIEKVEIFTKKTGIVILESLQEMSEYIVRLRAGIDEIINCLQDDNERDAMKKLEEISDGLEWIYNILNYAQTLNKISFKEIEFDVALDKFKGILPEVVESLENRDNIMLSDLLSYELAPIVDEIAEKLPVIYEKILEHEKKELNKKIN